jgi:hypothetical protein
VDDIRYPKQLLDYRPIRRRPKRPLKGLADGYNREAEPHHSLVMEQSTAWEANSLSASQEIPRFLRNPGVQHRVHKSSSLPKPCVIFRDFCFFYGKELLAPVKPESWRTTPCQLYVTLFVATLPIWRPSSLSSTWGRAMPRWQWFINMDVAGRSCY